MYTCCEAVNDTSISLAYLSTCTCKSSYVSVIMSCSAKHAFVVEGKSENTLF